MRAIRNRPWKAAGLAALVVLLPLGAPPAAGAAKVVNAKAVINSCGDDRLAITTRARPKQRVRGARSRRRLRRLRRKIRGAKLEVRFSAVALFGGERRSPWIRADRGGRASHSFSGLPADTWSGFIRFRWRKGGDTRATSFVNSSNGRVGGRRGRSLCSLGVGVPPRDTAAPFVTLFPRDSVWRRPYAARMFSKDDFSGVAATEYRVNGGPLRRGPDVPLGSQGNHRIDYRARDAAGNNSAFKRVFLRVDTGRPTAPVVQPLFAVTRDRTPTVRWSGSSDSGSGVGTYRVEIYSGGRRLLTRSAKSSARSLTLPTLPDNTNYSVLVRAFDRTDTPFDRPSAKRNFRVDTDPIYAEGFTSGCLLDRDDPPWVCDDPTDTGFALAGRVLTTSDEDDNWRSGGLCPGGSPGGGSATTPGTSFNASPGQKLRVGYARHFDTDDPNDSGQVDVRFDGGAWTTLRTFNEANAGTAGAAENVVDPPNGNHTIQVRFTLALAPAALGCAIDDPGFSVDNVYVVRGES